MPKEDISFDVADIAWQQARYQVSPCSASFSTESAPLLVAATSTVKGQRGSIYRSGECGSSGRGQNSGQEGKFVHALSDAVAQLLDIQELQSQRPRSLLAPLAAHLST
jgi:hypothetical protein